MFSENKTATGHSAFNANNRVQLHLAVTGYKLILPSVYYCQSQVQRSAKTYTMPFTTV